jgi:hypothetical protein
MSTNAKLSIAFVLLLVCGISYYAYSSHREKKIDAFRSYVLRHQGEHSVYRDIKRRELGLSQSEAAAVVAEAQAIKAFDNRK